MDGDILNTSPKGTAHPSCLSLERLVLQWGNDQCCPWSSKGGEESGKVAGVGQVKYCSILQAIVMGRGLYLKMQ